MQNKIKNKTMTVLVILLMNRVKLKLDYILS